MWSSLGRWSEVPTFFVQMCIWVLVELDLMGVTDLWQHVNSFIRQVTETYFGWMVASMQHKKGYWSLLFLPPWGSVSLAVSSSSWERRFLYSYERYCLPPCYTLLSQSRHHSWPCVVRLIYSSRSWLFHNCNGLPISVDFKAECSFHKVKKPEKGHGVSAPLAVELVLKNYRICRSCTVMWHQPYLLSYCRLIQSQHHFCRLWLWNEENLELKIGSIPLLKVITCLSLLGTGSGERGFSTSQFCWNWWCLRISWVSFMSISNCHFHAASPYTIRNQLGSWRGPLGRN